MFMKPVDIEILASNIGDFQFIHALETKKLVKLANKIQLKTRVRFELVEPLNPWGKTKSVHVHSEWGIPALERRINCKKIGSTLGGMILQIPAFVPIGRILSR